ncbi:MAG: uracil-DNA glycosylase [Lysobacterales bacterium CG17_big_fil_post_rev_8_21_14_2_50_64_11]|nr:MAG: uracil-DNA glycosylase [Xanthomonadales bacterium CG17_big_fil_post_rev_8_21_14_2_50_64_11]PIX59317.1 MAG: uracil-DNA glycosylase [Xanthomonadales bacterium CG_4_10_14_3_um_filter_64_11]
MCEDTSKLAHLGNDTKPAVRLAASWRERVGDYLRCPQMQSLAAFLRAERARGVVIYPPGGQMFAALDATPFDAVKVVILGQDPYHGPGQAHGLSFSVPPGVPVPPSLRNIFAEIERDLGIAPPDHGCLLPWAAQGVLLLNAVLSVQAGQAGSQQGRGWEGFTDHIVETLGREREGLVFMLWGSYAQAKGRIIDARRHCVLRAPHPSPLSAHRGFVGCGHFGKANRWLQGAGSTPINWRLPARAQLPCSPPPHVDTVE